MRPGDSPVGGADTGRVARLGDTRGANRSDGFQ
jgi:hypothetical protein